MWSQCAPDEPVRRHIDISTRDMNQPLADILQRGLTLHRGGAVEEAERHYSEVLRHDPDNADALCYLAMLRCQQKRFDQGVDLLQRALAVEPQRASAHNLLGMALHRLGRRDEALAHFLRAIAADPELAQAHGNRGLLLDEMGRHAEALACFDRALTIDPSSPVVWCNRGIALRHLARNEEAIASFDRAIALRPDAAEFHLNRGIALMDLWRMAEALPALDRAIALEPQLADAHSNRGIVMRLVGRFQEALASHDRAAALRPGEPGLIVSRAHSLRKLGRFEEAHAEYVRALQINPDLAAAHLGRGILLLELARYEEAQAAVEHAKSLDPYAPEHPNTLAYLQLLRGDWENGWNNYENRSRTRNPAYFPLPYTRWYGAPLAGERLVVLTEQGMGDAIQFCRFAPILAERGFDVTVLTERPLARLLATLPGVKVATTADEIEQDPRPIRWVPLMSVPGILGVRPDTIPAQVPYLSPDPALVEAWGRRLGGEGFKVGICWKSGPQAERISRSRDVPLADWAPLADIPGVRLITLQLGPGLEEIRHVPFRERIERIDDSVKDWVDTAAVMMNVDLVVTCDTSVPHLAGALARPTMLALPPVACWRWQLDRDDNPWYPSIRLFRKSMTGDWRDVIERIAKAVRQQVEQT
jgi:tetratricopeptide (TPR) repeat protein